AERGVLWEVQNERPSVNFEVPGTNALLIDKARQQFVLASHHPSVSWNFELAIPTDAKLLGDGQWHHVAFTYSRDARQLRHYLDGRLQALPGKGGFLPMMGKLQSLRLGRNLEGKQELHGLLDEMRISDTVRYAADFQPPASFSRNYGPDARPAAKADGPPLLFPRAGAKLPLALDGRKHLFIDDALLEKSDGLTFASNPPTRREVTDFRCDRRWDAAPRLGGGAPDVSSIFDDGDELKMIYTNGGMWGGKSHAICLAQSKDGVHWEKPALNVKSWCGSTNNNIVLLDTAQGMALRDSRPGVPPSERYKYVAWCMMRGFYVFTSPDCIHWQRNETIALPFDPDASISLYWDDQVGRHRGTIRSYNPSKGRGTARVNAPDLMRPWPFKPVAKPAWHWILPLPLPSSGELPEIDMRGETYRHMAVKYPWAPDVYLMFPWRYVAGKNIRPGSFLMVSRDGENWKVYENPYYFPAGWTMDGREVLEALTEQGLVRRGDQLWQWGTVRFTEHGGALYRGVEHEGSGFDRLLRLTQRLDGFVSLDAAKTGWAVTKPLTFAGRHLELNLVATGGARVAILDQDGKPLLGFDIADCRPIKGDSLRHRVIWKGGDLASLQGKTVRLRLKLEDAKLYALQFVGP
ncbi:MAG: LamG-like jellyroll fold domain-containing protein, partial [Tepidisphaeraceae bacterium]